MFAHAVIWQQAAPAPAPALAPLGSGGAAPGDRGGPALTLMPDPEVCARAHTILALPASKSSCRQSIVGELPERYHSDI